MATATGRRGLMIGVIVAAMALLVAGCLIGGALTRDAVDAGRSEGEDTLTAIAFPAGWAVGAVRYHGIREDLNYPTTWTLSVTAVGTDTDPAFTNAMRGAGWQQCGDGLTCWVKRPYRIAVTVQPGPAYLLEMKPLAE